MASDPLVVTERITIPGWDLVVETMRASGPGGQGVNTTDSAVRLRFQLDRCQALSEPVKRRLRALRPGDLTQDGELLLHAERSRSQRENLDDARERLVELIRRALVPPRPRVATKPTKASQRRRVEAKKRRSDVKAGRGRVDEG